MDVLSGGGLGTPKPPWYMFLIRFKMTSYGKLPILLSASQEALLAILQTHVQGYKATRDLQARGQERSRGVRALTTGIFPRPSDNLNRCPVLDSRPLPFSSSSSLSTPLSKTPSCFARRPHSFSLHSLNRYTTKNKTLRIMTLQHQLRNVGAHRMVLKRADPDVKPGADDPPVLPTPPPPAGGSDSTLLATCFCSLLTI